MIISLFVAAATTVGWSYMYWRRDRFEPEPRGLLLKLFIAGACVTLLAGLVNGIFDLILPAGFVLILVAPPVEELSKIAVVLLVAYRSQHFTQVVDGAIYGISCALGFAVVENLEYAVDFGVGILVTRSILLPLGHLLFTGVAGYYLGKAKFENRKVRRARPPSVPRYSTRSSVNGNAGQPSIIMMKIMAKPENGRENRTSVGTRITP